MIIVLMTETMIAESSVAVLAADWLTVGCVGVVAEV